MKNKIERKIKIFFSQHNKVFLKELIRAKLKARDHDSILGIFWGLIGPAMLLFILYFLFRTRFGKNITAYPLYILIGLVSVNFFANATTYLTKVFPANREPVLNSTILKETLIISDFVVYAYKFIIELGICYILSIFYGVFTWKSILLLPPLFTAYTAFVLGIGLILPIVYCFAKDIEYIWTILTRILFFATPIFYKIDTLSTWARKLVSYGNPLTPFVISFREAIEGRFNILHYAHSIILGFVFLAVGYAVFLSLENTALERV